MVDERRIRRLLQRIANDTGFLAEHGATAAPHDEVLLSAVKYRFITAIEGCIDVAQHLCASEGWGPPEDNGHALRILGLRGVLARDLADSLVRAVGFRNVLVHEYAEVDDERVLAQLGRLDELRAFIGAVATWLDAA